MIDPRKLYVLTAEVAAEINRVLVALGTDAAADAILRADSIEAETSLDVVAGMLIQMIGEAEANAAAVDGYSSTLQSRKGRYEHQAEKLRAVLGRLLDLAGAKSLATPFGTVSRTEPRVTVEVYDAAQLPQGFTRSKVEPDRIAIKAALEAEGPDAVPGARLALSPPGLSVRVK